MQLLSASSHFSCKLFAFHAFQMFLVLHFDALSILLADQQNYLTLLPNLPLFIVAVKIELFNMIYNFFFKLKTLAYKI